MRIILWFSQLRYAATVRARVRQDSVMIILDEGMHAKLIADSNCEQ